MTLAFIPGLKNGFRMAVQRARLEAGLNEGNMSASNAPLGSMTESPEYVVVSQRERYNNDVHKME